MSRNYMMLRCKTFPWKLVRHCSDLNIELNRQHAIMMVMAIMMIMTMNTTVSQFRHIALGESCFYQMIFFPKIKFFFSLTFVLISQTDFIKFFSI